MTPHGNGNDDHGRYEALLMKAVDGLIETDELDTFESHLESCEACRDELAGFRDIKTATDALRDRMAADAGAIRIERAPGTQALTWIGWLALLIGYVVLFGWSGWQLWQDASIPMWVRFGIGAIGFGFMALLLRVLWTRLRTYGSDPYREIDR